MLKTSPNVTSPAVEHLLHLWSRRFTLDLSSLLIENDSSHSCLVKAASPEGRALTSAKLKDNILDVHCQMAWIQTKTLYGYISNVLDLNEARQITQFAFRVYRKLLEIYQQQSLENDSLTTKVQEKSVAKLGIPAIEEVAYALEPILMVFQEQHIASRDWRALGFMTTQLNFSNKLILKKLTPSEKILLTPYLKFVEEQVAIPWQRVCAAAVKHELDSAMLALVQQMLPISQDIAQSVYYQLGELLPNHRSRRGGLSDPEVRHSCLRDLNMFQAYIWLSLLEESTVPLEKELLPLCQMVVQGVNIPWEMTEKWCQLLADEMLSRVDPEHQNLLLPYIQAMKQIFFKQRQQLGFTEETIESVV
ncbi:hypothetical protein BZZ01_14735 [Nostocales cyanobacterium HT-58-2]|nr:hypothetical protein BZZ01_14735 [Nostocales cyanobacterium HT-58-2]